MKIFKLFKRKKKEPEIIEEPETRNWKHLCSNCNKPIYEGEGWTKNQMGRYHRRCWKMMVNTI